MVDQAVFSAQSEAAFQLASTFLNHADGWTVLASDHGLTASVISHDGHHVGKFHATSPKTPVDILKAFAGNLVHLRQAHFLGNVSTEYVAEYPDKSHIVKEVNGSEQFGEIVEFNYYTLRPSTDGTFYHIGHGVDHESYPRGAGWVDFVLTRLVPTESGTDITLVIAPKSNTIQFTEEIRNALALKYKHFYDGVLGEINSAA